MKWTNHKAALSLMYDGPQRLFTISYNVGFKPSREERVNISNLVGAAPELLAALENIIANLDDAGETAGEDGNEFSDITAARAAIDRAKGVSA